MIADSVFARAAVNLPCWVRDEDGTRSLLPLQRWMGNSPPEHPDTRMDEALLDACAGSTLDLGCGPGRFTAALTARGIRSLGVDSSAVAVELTQRRGGHSLHRDIYDPLPRTGRWQHILLADGNIGIGADPTRILRRACELVAPGGTVVVELPPATHTRPTMIRWETDSAVSVWFPWTSVSGDDIESIACEAALSLSQLTELDGSYLAVLQRDAHLK